MAWTRLTQDCAHCSSRGTFAGSGNAACPGKRDEKFQSAADEAVRLIDQYVIANGGSQDEANNFKREQGGAGVKDSQLCTGETLEIYDHLRSQGSESLLKATRAVVSKPGKPTWGDCV